MSSSSKQLQPPSNYLIPGRRFFDGVVAGVNRRVTADPATADVYEAAGVTSITPRQRTQFLPFDVRLQDAMAGATPVKEVFVYLPDGGTPGADDNYVTRNGYGVSGLKGAPSAPWVSLGNWDPEAIAFVVVKIIADGDDGFWPGNYAAPALYDVELVTSVPTDPEATPVVVAELIPEKGLVQLRRGAINTSYTLMDGEVRRHGDEPDNWFRSLDTEFDDYISGWYGFRTPDYVTELHDTRDSFPIRSEGEGDDPTVVKYIKWEDLLALVDPSAKPDWWEYGPDAETWPCISDTVVVWDPCEGDWTRKKFWVSGDTAGSTTYGDLISDTAAGGAKGKLAIGVSDRLLYDKAATPRVSVDWGERQLVTSALTGAVNWELQRLIDAAGLLSVDWLNRRCIDTSNKIAVDWENRACNDAAGETALNWNTRVCNDSDGDLSIDWENHTLGYFDEFDNERITINWETCEIRDKVSLLSVKWATRELYDDGGALAVTFKGTTRELHGNWKAASMAAVHKTAAGGAAVANGTYTVGIGPNVNGTITVTDGVVTAVTEAS